MEGETYILVTGLLFAVLANLPEVQAQDECKFYGENLTGDQINLYIAETVEGNTVILNLTTSEGYANCSDLTSSVGFSKYIGYSHTETTNLTFFIAQEIGDDLDNGDIKIMPDATYPILYGQCKLYCQQGTTSPLLYVVVVIEPKNTQQPTFSQTAAILTLDENYPIGLDFSDQLVANGERLKVTDMDLPLEELIFDVSDQRFKALPPRLSYYKDSKDELRVDYEPCIAVNTSLNAADSPITFNLIAKNNEKESSFSITIHISPHDMRDPEFERPYYTSIVPDTQFTGFLTVKPQNILAYDGDIKIDKEIRYEIADKAGLDVNIKNQQPGKGIPIEIELTQSAEGSATDKMRYIVIKAIQIDDTNRAETVVLAVELAQGITTMSTSTASTTGPTCPPCLTSTTSEATTVITTCPTFDPITNCPEGSTTGNSTACAVCPSTTDTAQTTTSYTNPSLSTSPSSSITTSGTVSATITSTAASITSTRTEGTPSNSCPACPSESVTNCPTTCPTCPTDCQQVCTTESTIRSSSTSTETPTSIVSTSSPMPCPELTTLSSSTSDFSTTPTCNCPTIPTCNCPTTPSGVTCPTTSPPLGGTVHFDKQQYASELVENSPVRTLVVTLHATSTSTDEQPEYSFVEGYDTKYFTVDPKTGVVTTTQSLPIGNYSLEAIAEIPSGAKDYARIVVSAIMGTLCSGTQFSSPLYEFPVAERTTGIVGQVELRSTDDTPYNLIITSCNPPSMIDDFEVKPNGTLVVVRPFNWTATLSRITLTITAMSQPNLRITSISTIVNLDVLDINDAPEFVGYTTSMLVGYPERTYLDPSVQMPLFTVKALDSDSNENASLTYHLAKEFEFFDIDVLSGSLYVRGLGSLGSTSSWTVEVLARDKHGLQDNLNITVKSLGNEFIILMKAKSDSDTVTAETVASDMSRILGYQVVVLRLEKGLDSEAGVRQLRNGYAYKITLYAIDRTAFINREDFVKHMDQVDTSGLSWTIDGSLSAPLEYEAETIIDELSKEAQGYEIATIVLATLFGVTLILIIAHTVYVKKFEMKRPWSRAFPAASLEVDKKHWDQRSLAHSSSLDDEQVLKPPIDSYNSKLSGISNVRAAPTAIHFVAGKTSGNDIQAPQSPVEDEAYCPPTPLPKKSILKDPNAMDKNNKQRTEGDYKLEDTSAGVKFNSTPEVIKVAATAPGPPVEEVDLPNNNNEFDDDDDFLIEEF